MYLNQVKAAAKVDKLMGRIGLSKVAPLTGVTVPNTALDLMLRAVPMPRAERCGKALCRWINAIYGCTHTHDQLDDATHDQLDDMFGIGAWPPSATWARSCAAAPGGRPLGREYYTPPRAAAAAPSCWCRRRTTSSGRRAACTLRWLQTANEASLYERALLPGYAHLGALIGRDAAADVFPVLSEHLDRFNR